MYSNRQTQFPTRMERDYVIYFYESGLSGQYRQRQKDLWAGLNEGPAGFYDFSSDLLRRRPAPVGQTVEQIVRKGYLSIPRSEPETAIVTDRKNTAWLGLDDIIGQIRNRYRVYESNLHELERAKCTAINCLHEHEAYHGPATSKVEYSVHKRLDGLYSEQREERINLWRDVSRLKLQLPEAAQNYLNAYRKTSILEDKQGDLL